MSWICLLYTSGNNPDRQNIYGAALGLYNSRIVKLINKKGMLKSSVIIDELPTIYFKGLDNLIATARSNKVAVCLGFQDFSQLVRDYGDKEAKVVMNTVGNIFSGQVVGETAKTLSERFGKVLQKRQSISINRQDVSTSINTQMDSLIPPSKISGLTQEMCIRDRYKPSILPERDKCLKKNAIAASSKLNILPVTR